MHLTSKPVSRPAAQDSRSPRIRAALRWTPPQRGGARAAEGGAAAVTSLLPSRESTARDSLRTKQPELGWWVSTTSPVGRTNAPSGGAVRGQPRLDHRRRSCRGDRALPTRLERRGTPACLGCNATPGGRETPPPPPLLKDRAEARNQVGTPVRGAAGSGRPFILTFRMIR